MRCAELGLALLLIAACGDGGTEPRSPSGLAGNYAGFWSDHGMMLAVHLEEQQGMISGTAWSTVLLHGAAILGTYHNNEVHFQMDPGAGGSIWYFNGRLAADTLRGEFAFVPTQGFLMELVRVDTVPSGSALLTLSGAITATATGSIVQFGYDLFFHTALYLETAGAPTYRLYVGWQDSNPAPGTYDLHDGPGTNPRISLAYTPVGGPLVSYTGESGTLVVDASNRYSLIGHLNAVLKDPVTNDRITVQGSFSAGCFSKYC